MSHAAAAVRSQVALQLQHVADSFSTQQARYEMLPSMLRWRLSRVCGFKAPVRVLLTHLLS